MVVKEIIENFRRKRFRAALKKARGKKRERIEKELAIMKQDRRRRVILAKARSDAKFKSQLQAAREQPAFDEAQRQATQSFRLAQIRRGKAQVQKKKGALAQIGEAISKTGVANTPVIRRGGIGPARGVDVIGGKSRKGFRVI